MGTANRRNAVGWQPTTAELAKLSPSARASIERELKAVDTDNARAKEKRFEVSYYAPAAGRRVTHRDPIVAATKAGAIAEVKAWIKSMAYVGLKGATNFMASERKSNPATEAIPFFCANCGNELNGKSVQMRDSQHVCARCAQRAKDKSIAKQQSRLFEEQSSLFQNGKPRRNVEMGFVDHVGVFHPIRISKDYNEFRTTDVASPDERRARSAKYQTKLGESWYRDEDKKRGRQFARQHKSLAQFVRSAGGIAPPKDGNFSGELAALRSAGTRRGQGTSGLINQHNRQGAQRYGPEYMMDAANAEGYRDRHGEKFENIGDFLAAVADDVSGIKKLYSHGDLNDYYNNPMTKKKATKKKAVKRAVKKKVVCSRCGGAHNVAYCPKSARSTEKKQNILGLDRKSRKSRAKKRAAKRAYKADRLEAKVRYLRTKVNPKLAGAVKKIKTAAAKLNPMHPLEMASHVAVILSGVETAKHMVRKKKKARRPTAHAAGKRLAERRHKKNGGVKAVSKKAKRNSAGEIFEDFNGRQSTRITTGYVAPDAPVNVDLLGPVTQLTLANGKRQVKLGNGQVIMGEVKRFSPNAVMLNAVKKNGGKRRFVVGVRKDLRERWLKKNPSAKGQNFNFGPVAEVCYLASKPHLLNGDKRIHTWYHILGEEGGRRPSAMLKNGMPALVYGDYEIKTEGIRN